MSGENPRGITILGSRSAKKIRLAGDMRAYLLLSHKQHEKYTKEKIEKENTPEFKQIETERQVIKDVTKIDDEIESLHEQQRAVLHQGIVESARARIQALEGEPTDADIKTIIRANKDAFARLIKLCKDSQIPCLYYNHLEKTFIDLINTNIKFIYYAPAKVIIASDIKLSFEEVIKEGDKLINLLIKAKAIESKTFCNQNKSLAKYIRSYLSETVNI